MRVILGALVAVLLATTATAQTTIEQRNQWRRQAAEYEATAAGLRKAAECEMPDFPTGWQYRMEVTPQDLRSISGTVTNFPAKLTIASANLSNALANGHDVLFTKVSDGTTVLPSYRVDFSEVAGVPTWRGIVLIDSYSPDDTLLVNYGNPDASDSSTTAAMTGGGWIHWLNWQAAPESELLDAITGATGQIVQGSFQLQDGQSAGWKSWYFADNIGHIRFRASTGGNLQQAAPFARFFRIKVTQATNNLFLSSTPDNSLSVGFPWTGYRIFGFAGLNTALTFGDRVDTPFDFNSWQAYSEEFDAGSPTTIRTWWKGSPSQTKTLTGTWAYSNVATGIGPGSGFNGGYYFEELIWLQHGLGNTYHQALAFNTGGVTLSEQEEAVVVSVADLSVTDSRRYNLSVTDSARYNLTVADTLATDLTLGQEPTD